MIFLQFWSSGTCENLRIHCKGVQIQRSHDFAFFCKILQKVSQKRVKLSQNPSKMLPKSSQKSNRKKGGKKEALGRKKGAKRGPKGVTFGPKRETKTRPKKGRKKGGFGEAWGGPMRPRKPPPGGTRGGRKGTAYTGSGTGSGFDMAGTLSHGGLPLLRGARRIQAGKPEHGAPPFGVTVACLL